MEHLEIEEDEIKVMRERFVIDVGNMRFHYQLDGMVYDWDSNMFVPSISLSHSQLRYAKE